MAEEKKRIKTNIQGLDEQMMGGIPEKHIVLLSGAPGTMKSSIAYNIIYNAAREKGTNSIYITLEQSRDSLLEQMKGLKMDVDKVEDNVRVLDLGLIRKNLTKLSAKGAWLDVFKMYAKNLKDSFDYEVMVLDSLDVLEIMAKFTDPRVELFGFFEWLRDLGCTVVLISEKDPDMKGGRYDEGYLADGIIGIALEKVSDIDVMRTIRIYKMRSTKHSPSVNYILHEEGKFYLTKKIAM